jgi:putative ABC transport system substrate-binding protein
MERGVRDSSRRALIAALLAGATWPCRSLAQGAVRTARIGWLTAQTAASLEPYLRAMRASLAEVGLVEGRNLTIEYRYADGAIERVPELAAELQGLPVEVLVAQGAAVSAIAPLELKVPVAYVFSGDPVSAGFAESLARPRGNMTGLTFMAAELNAKRLEMMAEFVPALRRIAIVANPEHPGVESERGYAQAAARRLDLRLDYYATRSADELDAAFAAMSATPPQALSVFADGFAIEHRQRIAVHTARACLPYTSGWPVFARYGALFTYGPRLVDSYRRLAYYVDRLLKGTKPAGLPIERPTTFELVINRQTAAALRIDVPEALLIRADEVID